MALIEYERSDGLGVITLNRPEAHNAQSEAFLHELDDAWRQGAGDPEVKVIVLKANGKHFSAGHDMASKPEEREVAQWGAVGQGIAPAYLWEHRVFFGYSRRWRDVPKPSIAAVQGACIAAGLMLCWPCDIIIASDDAYFSDPVIRMGVGGGVEYHGHTWEWGPRKAKEMLFTGRKMPASEALELGMVSQVVPRDDLESVTLQFARGIAQHDRFALAQAKRAVNVTMDIIGQHAALESAFDIHWLGHSNALVSTGNESATLVGLAEMKAANKGNGRG
jgi:enoyl-CoA hydratase